VPWDHAHTSNPATMTVSATARVVTRSVMLPIPHASFVCSRHVGLPDEVLAVTTQS
jgi:hypothetical protein